MPALGVVILPVEAPVLHAPSTTVPDATKVRPAATPGVSESVLVQNTTIFNNSKAKTKLQSHDRACHFVTSVSISRKQKVKGSLQLTLVVASPEIASYVAVVAYVFLCVKEEAERERQKDCERVRVAM
ncbi:hypothetical protein DVH24_040876 [Malus domestica]|uniref:Uncharacterized protein n=1 Tax=Malus domestica TaxID=3750 RepID=A0A498I9X9_MALDO|nr:hypothetical protein DVH24_040876 [Malus domestica]